MATTYDVPTILANIAVLSNCPPFGASTKVTLAQATFWVGQSARELSALLRQKFPEDRDYLQIASISTVPDFAYSSLPEDCGEVHAVVWQRGPQDAVLLKSAQSADLAQQLEDGQSWDDVDVDPRWRIEGQTLAVYPTSATAEDLTVYYTTHISPTSGTFQGRLSFDRWVELDVCIQVATAKDKDQAAAKFQQQKALLENDLLNKARGRDVNKTHTIGDVRQRDYAEWMRTRGYR